MTLSLIAAINRKNVIGKDNKLPWHVPADLKRFKEMTLGHVIIMGRCTYESIGKPLPNRLTIVVSTKGVDHPGIICVPDLTKAVHMTCHAGERFIVGGAKLYEAAIPMCNKMYLTHINDESEGDTFFPAYNPEDWSSWNSKFLEEPYAGHWIETLERRRYG